MERLEPTGAKLVALLDDGALAPREAGPVFRALETRLGSARLGASLRWDAERGRAMRDLAGDRAEARDALGRLARAGCLKAAGVTGPDRLASRVAADWVEDGTWNRMALAWTNDEVHRINTAVRARLDRSSEVRRNHVPSAGSGFGDLRPLDRIRILKGTSPAAGLPAEGRFRAGDLAEYLGRDGGGASGSGCSGVTGGSATRSCRPARDRPSGSSRSPPRSTRRRETPSTARMCWSGRA